MFIYYYKRQKKRKKYVDLRLKRTRMIKKSITKKLKSIKLRLKYKKGIDKT